MITEPTVLGHKGFVPCASGALYNTVRALGPYPKTGWPTSRVQHHSQADDLRARFKVPEWGVFWHTARL